MTTKEQDSAMTQTLTEDRRRSLLILLGCAVAVLVGSFGPWAKEGLVTVDGTQTAGVATVFLGGLALLSGAVLYLRHDRWGVRVGVMAVLFLSCLLIGGYIWNDLTRAGADAGVSLRNPAPSWGIYLMMAGSLVGFLLACSQLRRA